MLRRDLREIISCLELMSSSLETPGISSACQGAGSLNGTGILRNKEASTGSRRGAVKILEPSKFDQLLHRR